MSKADGSVIIETKIDTEGVKQGTKEIKDELGDVGESSSKANDSIGGDLVGGFKKLGKAIAAAKVVEKLYEFGKEAIELGSDLQEVQNVVDVTFTTMSDKVNKFAKDAQKSAGLSETMAKKYVGTFGAMADSFGFTEAEAYEMSTALTQLTGDVASFYNLSQDEAMNKLKGVFTGETEALKELGVVMTQAALDNYALANGYEKTTTAMTEQEKVALRYQFVMDQLSASSGDFVRTQDSWANQSKVLSLQWESLMATIGTGLITALSPGLEFINDKALPALEKLAERFAEAMEPTPAEALSKSLKNLDESIKSADENFEKAAEQVEINAMMAENYKNRLAELESTGLDTAESQAAYAAVIDQLNALYPELNLRINEHTGLLDADSRAALNNMEAYKQKYLYMAVEEQLTALYQAQGEAQAALNKAMYDREQVTNSLTTAEKNLAATSELSIEELISLYDATDGGARAIENMDGSVVALTKDQMDLIKNIKDLRQQQDNLNGKIKEGQGAVDGLNQEITETSRAYGVAGDDANQFADDQERVTQAVTETQSQLDTLQSEYDSAKSAAYNSINSQVGLFDELTVKSSSSASQIISNWESQQAAFESYKANLEKAVDMGLDEALVKQLSDGSTESMAILEEFVSQTDVSVEDINTAFRKTEESKEIVAGAMAAVQTEMSDKLAALSGSVSSAWGDMAYTVSNKIQQMQNSINSLSGKTVSLKITTNSSSGGSHYDINSGMPRVAAASADVPYLASGAVIPPNAPFMAVLGDQRHGTNVEAPLSTIQEAVAVVMADNIAAMMSGFGALLEESQYLRQAVASIRVGDDTIGQAYERYERKMAIVRGW